MKRIVVGYDGSERADRALARAAELAKALGAGLTVVSVEPPRMLAVAPMLEPADAPIPALPASGGTGAPVPLPRLAEDRHWDPEDLVQRHLDHARTVLAGRHVEVEVELVAEIGDPAERLLEHAQQRDADLIVVGSGEHGFLDRLLRRHVDEEVAAHAAADVLLVR